MRISDWSSDVCSSDLGQARLLEQRAVHVEPALHRDVGRLGHRLHADGAPAPFCGRDEHVAGAAADVEDRAALAGDQIGRGSCRERVCPDVYISVVAAALQKNKTKTHTTKNYKK